MDGVYLEKRFVNYIIFLGEKLSGWGKNNGSFIVLRPIYKTFLTMVFLAMVNFVVIEKIY